MQKLISITLQSDFGFFRKPDANNTINLSYNILHKPALLGILGAIIGLEGYKEFGKIPEYYEKLQDLKIGVSPLQHEKGNFQKTVIKYSNTVGYANKGATYLTEEAILIKPAYKVYVLLNIEKAEHLKLYEYLKEGKAEYLPYFGKNEFYAWWDSYENDFKEYDDFDSETQPEDSFHLDTLFTKKEQAIKDQKEDNIFDFLNFENMEATYLYFERLPVGFDDKLYQYNLENFVYTTFKLRVTTVLDNLYFIKSNNYYVQLH